MAINYLPSLNYPGSSRYGVTRTFPQRPEPNVQDYGVIDAASGKVISLKTGQPWTGVEPRTGKQYLAGSPVPQTAVPTVDPNNPNARYKPVDIVKSPTIAAATTDLLDAFKKSADASLTDFNANLKNFTGSLNTAMARANAAADIEPFAATTRAMQSRYAGALDTSAEEYARLNAENEARMRAIEAEGRGILPQYDAAAAAIANRQESALRNQINRYKAASGTPTSLGSAEERMLLRGVADIRLPLEQAKIARQYDLLSNLSLPIQRELAARETARISQFEPYVAGQQFTSGTGVENTIQNLKMQTANMSLMQADAYLRSLALPEQIRQQILGGRISELGGIAALEEGSRYRGLQDVIGVNVSQPEYYSVGTPGYPTTRYNVPNVMGGGFPVTASTPLASNPARVVRPATVPAGGINYDANDYVENPANNIAAPTVYAGGADQGSRYGTMSYAYYDTVTGTIRDNRTGEVLQNVENPALNNPDFINSLRYT